MRIVWQSVVSIALGFIGGVVATKLPVTHQQVPSEVRAETVRAARFELVDSSGKPLAYWGQDKQEQRVLIAFVDEKGQVRARFGTEAIKLQEGRPFAYSPFVALVGSDGKARMRQRLDSSQNPVLVMGDSKSENRLLLGHWLREDVAGEHTDAWDKWSLVLRDPSQGWRDYVDIGVTTPLNTKQRTGYLVLRNSTGRQLSEMPNSSGSRATPDFAR